ncbi:DUF4381 domain-containing protein [Pseudolysobacter antarcticus]|uniref:DUF4381 domain-containing protein n=1 Tax=Pseudolysobacter antarcticus TaxID=2511995 RepID=A0A411HNC8_9GAMM|nr:DUF4381 domain-containing protein [Pseudolysobacter antarcticus]QBB71989.1 DUF4381 domain-containing protein [Pseudolysobacter antarcticus]
MNPNDAPVLQDIHLPPDPSWWPPAPGWWLLAFVLFVMIALIVRFSVPRWRQRRRSVRALAEFENIVTSFHGQQNHLKLAADLSQYLRRVTLLRMPHAVALSGDAWLDHLDTAAGTQEFRTGIGRVLLDAPYRPAQPFDAPALIALTRRWTCAVLRSSHA